MSDFEWFVENYDALCEQYGDSCLAIKNRSVIGAYKTFDDALLETAKSEELGTFLIQECQKGIKAYIMTFQNNVYFPGGTRQAS